ncbi:MULTISPECIES: threonine synthase [unclassified Chelatococcus]|uniref:threonine synthase n=1 Tax=unclassified Chelatococcus TaxID=2638111 RepID=UPI001BCF0496|nr:MULTISPECIES: threonine synthase [unclassified Chelatococcus]MBS7695754.1 threonine synthase [Chelatococcus sp. YT9]MBX3555871.1 threonine synthase [Chelatococcus sp.]
MLHVSTRGEAPVIGFTEALLAGLARDGGLYVPGNWPVLSQEEIAGFAGRSYEAIAGMVVGRLTGGEIPDDVLAGMIKEAYATFRHPAVCPLVQLDDNLFVLELFHGPTLAFKDVAMQLLGRMMDHVLKARGERATIVGATSGDTGSAAIEAFRGLDQVDVFILYPHGRVSEVQRRQMTTVDAPNVHAIAVEGTFDDCQAILKGLFNNHAFRDALKLSGVNSINWARIVAQTVYYFTAGVSLGAPHRPVSFSVPTGNFGDVFAGYAAKRMGLPVAGFTIATNDNDILARTLNTGSYTVTGVKPTSSPSMDIQVSSNFERLLFDAYGRDANEVRRLMAHLTQAGSFTIGDPSLAAIRSEFGAEAVSEEETSAEIAQTWKTAGYLTDPHTAVALAAARRAQSADPSVPMVALSTAHPAKFPDAVEQASGVRPPLPDHLADLYERPEHFTVVANDASAIEAFIRNRARALQ